MSWVDWFDTLVGPRLILKSKQLSLFHGTGMGGGRGAAVGEVHQWKDGPHEKVAPGEWKAVGPPANETTAPEKEEKKEEVKGKKEEKKPKEFTIRSVTYRGEGAADQMRDAIVRAAGKNGHAVLTHLRLEYGGEREARKEKIYSAWGTVVAGYTVPECTTWKVHFDYDPKIPGHSLVGHIKEGRVTTFGDAKVTHESFERALKGDCDVCKTKRRRNAIYVVRENESGKQIIVGGECAKKFQGHDLVDAFADMDAEHAMFSAALAEVSDGYDGLGDSGPKRFNLSTVFAAAAVVTANGGYVKGQTPAEVASLLIDHHRDQLSHGDRSAMVDQTKWVDEHLPKIKSWISEMSDAERTKGVADFYTTLNHIINTRGVADMGDIGRLAWVVTGYKRHAGLLEAAKALGPKKDPVAYAPGTDKKHNLPGEWVVVSIKESQSNYGPFVGMTAVSESGERIWFRQTPALQDTKLGDKLKLEGKFKSKSGDGTMSFMTHVGPIRTEAAKKEKKEERSSQTKTRNDVLKTYKAMAKDPNFWRTPPNDISDDIQKKLGWKSNVHGTVMALWNESLKGALAEGVPDALTALDEATHADDDLLALRRVVTSRKRWYETDYPTKEEAIAQAAKWPKLADAINRSQIRNPQWESLTTQINSEARRLREEWHGKLMGTAWWDSYRGSPDYERISWARRDGRYDGPEEPKTRAIDLGINITGVPHLVTLAEADAGIVTSGRLSMDRLRAIDETLREVKSEKGYGVHELRASWESFISGHKDVGAVVSSAQKAIADPKIEESDMAAIKKLLAMIPQTMEKSLRLVIRRTA